jgi:NADH-quinone oxidoreductase subunit L
VAVAAFGRSASWVSDWAGPGVEFALRLDRFSGFIQLAAAGFAAAVALYSLPFMAARPFRRTYYAMLLLSLAMTNGAVLADHLVALLFFWEGLLLTLFGMIAIGRPGAFKTAIKAFVIVGVTDLCLMLGIALAGAKAGTLRMSALDLPLDGIGCAAMLLMMVGAVSKAGSMPFHSWIPDAAVDAPLPFMAFLPASLEKLLGIYLLSRITLEMFAFTASSWISPVLMTLGAITILLAVMMALVQRDYKRLLSFHAISQVGYMMLGIGTAVPVGIVGGIFHMINHAIYKSGLFLTAGAVERQTGTTDLARLGGLGRRMPVTFLCFIVTAASISGVPPFNGFFSKELVYDGALSRGVVFYLAAVLGSFFTAASFLKLGHAAFLGRRGPASESAREAPLAMLVPMLVLAGFCVLFGLANGLPLRHLVQPVLGEARLAGHDFAGLPENAMLAVVTVLVLAAALFNHWMGSRAAGSGLGASDHIHHAPGLGAVYARAERGEFDPYEVGRRIANPGARALWFLDRAADWITETAPLRLAMAAGRALRAAHNGSYVRYILWGLLGSALGYWLTR